MYLFNFKLGYVPNAGCLKTIPHINFELLKMDELLNSLSHVVKVI